MPKEAESHENEDEKDQMEWDRLQNEALSAQRYRLEEEIEQARAQGLISGEGSGEEPFMGIDWSSKLVFTGVGILLVAAVVAVALVI